MQGPPEKQAFALLEAPTLFKGLTRWLLRPGCEAGGSSLNVPTGTYSVYLIGESQHVVGAADVTVAGPGDTAVTVGEAGFPEVSMHVTVVGELKSPRAPLIAVLNAFDDGAN